MRLRFRKSFKVWPFTWHFTQNGFSSWSIKIWRWSYNSRRYKSRVDLPGGFHLG